MTWLANLNLIAAFDIYLLLAFLLSTALRLRQYRAMLGLVFSLQHRWPKLSELVHRHKTIFMTWQSVLPIASTFALMLVQMLASRLLWADARVTPLDLWHHWIALVGVLVLSVLMLYFDYQATFVIGDFDRAAVERDFDRAEYWLRSWVAPVLHVVTFGYVNPRRAVNEEVRKAIADVSQVVNEQMWSWTVQLGVRLAFGLCLWLTWALALRDAAS